jgi:uncharacterized damage-inducible protein DinB
MRVIHVLAIASISLGFSPDDSTFQRPEAVEQGDEADKVRAPARWGRGPCSSSPVFDGQCRIERESQLLATMTLTEVLLTEASATYQITELLFRRVRDDELSWTPATGSGWMTLGQLLMHCASFGCGKAIRGFVAGDWGQEVRDSTEQDHVPPARALPSVNSVRQALELLAADRDLAIGNIQVTGERSLLERKVTAPWGGPEMCLFQQLLRMIAHLAQHKGQLFYYLKLMGKDVKTVDLWGP